MSGYGSQTGGLVLPRPGKALKWVLITLFAVWLTFALAINWGGASPQLFNLLCGNTEAILAGQVWRLFTAPFMHVSTGSIGHILAAMIGLYFLSPSLESAWGSKRFVSFLLLSSVSAYLVQAMLDLVLPAGLASKLVPPYWFGAIPAVEAVAIAWALSFKGRTVRLFFILPISSRGLILFVVGFSLMALIAGMQPASGHIALFAGMGAGWLFGGGTPSPARRWYLKRKLSRLDAEARQTQAQEQQARQRRIQQSKLRVIKGGNGDSNDGNGSNGANGDGSGRPGGYLN